MSQVRRQTAIVWGLVLFLGLGGGLLSCRRLNPRWCSSDHRCALGYICDPVSNVCRSLDGGALDSSLDVGVADLAPADVLFERSPTDRFPASEEALDFSVADQLAICSDGSPSWYCYHGSAGLCDEDGYSEQRRCPAGACDNGHCLLPAAPQTCVSNLSCGIEVCTLLLDGELVPQPFCAAPVSGINAPETCYSGFECATGLCTEMGRCYYACHEQTECPPNFQCSTVEVVVEGESISARSCTPL